jgi:hypothetical protein
MKTPESFKFVVRLILCLNLVSSIHAQPDTPIWKFANLLSPSTITGFVTDSVGNCYSTGTFMEEFFRYGNDSVPGNAGENTSAFVMKTNPTGKLVWLYSVFGTGNMPAEITKMSVSERGEVALIVNVAQTDHVWIGDHFMEADSGNNSVFVVKIAKNTKINWIHRIISTDYDVYKGQVEAMDLFIQDAGDVFVTGYFRGASAQIADLVLDGTEDFAMLFVAHIEPDGIVSWFKDCPYSVSKSTANIYATIMKNTPGNRFYIGGYYDGNQDFYFGPDTINNATADDAFIACYTKDGQSQWAQAFHGDSNDYPENIAVLKNGDPVFLGFCNSFDMNIGGTIYTNPSGNYNIYLARYSATGNLLNSNNIPVQKNMYMNPGKNVYFRCDNEENLILCSEFQSSMVFQDVFTLINPDPGTKDLLIAKLNNLLLSPVWTFQGTAPGDNDFDCVHIDKLGNVFFAGTSYRDLIMSTDVVIGDPTYGNPYTVKVNTEGAVDYAFWQLNGADREMHMNAISSDAYGNAYVLGNFYGLSNSLGGIDLIAPGSEGSFIAKYSKVKNIIGTVSNDEGIPLRHGYVKIFGYTYYQRSPLNDSVTLGADGNFEFKEVPAGDYLVVAKPTGEDAEVYIPTYFPSVEYWEFAQHIRTNDNSDPGILHIIMQHISEFSGNTQMNGNVSYIDEEKVLQSHNLNKGRPTKKATVVLAGNKKPEKTTYEIVATVETDDEGNFAFSGIEDGMYYLWVDIPGLPCIPVYLIEVTGGQYISNLDYLVNEEFVEAEGSPDYNPVDFPEDMSGIMLYPVPSKDLITLIIPECDKGIADIFDPRGSHIRHIELTRSASQIDVSDLQPGNYTIRIYFGDSITFKKFIVIH